MKNTIARLLTVGSVSLSALACQNADEGPTGSTTGRIAAGEKSQALGIAEYELIEAPGQIVAAGYATDGTLLGLITLTQLEQEAMLGVNYGGDMLSAHIAEQGELNFNGAPVDPAQEELYRGNFELLAAAEHDLDLPQLKLFPNGEVADDSTTICISVGMFVTFQICYTFDWS